MVAKARTTGWKRRRLAGLAGSIVLALCFAPQVRAEPSNPVGDETFVGSFVCLSPSSATDTGPVLCESDINPSLPSFDFSLVWHADKTTGLRVLDRIEISRKGEAVPFQSIGGVESRVPPHMRNNGFELLDLNFDGYLDMRVIRDLPAGPNTPYQNWLWSRGQGKFIASPALDAITAPQFDADAQEITSDWRDGAAEHGSDIYAYDGADPVLIHREKDVMSADGSCLRTYYDRIDDELRKTGTGPCDAD
jgi:hypothetical protein